MWCKQLADGYSVAVVLLNLDDSAHKNVTADFSKLGLSGSAKVRDLWAKADLPAAASGSLTASVPPHGTRMFKLTTPHSRVLNVLP